MTPMPGPHGSPPPEDPGPAGPVPPTAPEPVGALPRGATAAAVCEEVRRALADVPREARVLVAASGGADSTGMAVLVGRARPDLVRLACHVRHGLRDDTADLAAVRKAMTALGLPLLVRSVRVDRRQGGEEAAARTARYTALHAAATSADTAHLLVAHTADDQAETLLLALGRGTGLAGLAGMRRRRAEGDVTLIRPVLRIRRADVRAAVGDLPVAVDPTNSDPRRRRTRVRQAVLPALGTLAGGEGDPVALLTRLASHAREDADLLDALSRDEVDRLVRRLGPARLVDADELGTLPVALQRRVVRALLAGAGAGTPTAGAVARVLALPAGARTQVDRGVLVQRAGRRVVAVPLGGLSPRGPDVLALPGTVRLPGLDVDLRADRRPCDRLSGPVEESSGRDGWAALGLRGHRHAVVELPEGVELVVRAPAAGDDHGGRPLRRLLQGAGVPGLLRPVVPVVAARPRGSTQPGRPVWVPGLRVPPRSRGHHDPVHLTLSEGQPP